MQKTLLVLSLLVLVSFASFKGTANLKDLRSLWQSWKTTHRKVYNVKQEAQRFSIFIANYKKIVQFNAKSKDLQLGLNQFSDLTSKEFEQQYMGAFVETDQDVINANLFTPEETLTTPNNIDWRAKGAVTGVKNQGSCGSCWAFSATGVLEGFYKIRTGSLVSFSEQQFVDCSKANFGCNGGWPYKALDYAKAGVEKAADYPYTGRNDNCKFNPSKAIKVNSGSKFVTARNSAALKQALGSQPVSVLVQANQPAFQSYKSGVISSGCGTTLNHAILAVGFGTFSGKEAFIVKNSWGTGWGMSGYAYISTDQSINSGFGACGVLGQPVIAS